MRPIASDTNHQSFYYESNNFSQYPRPDTEDNTTKVDFHHYSCGKRVLKKIAQDYYYFFFIFFFGKSNRRTERQHRRTILSLLVVERVEDWTTTNNRTTNTKQQRNCPQLLNKEYTLTLLLKFLFIPQIQKKNERIKSTMHWLSPVL